jgi:hypothetical protein
MSILWKLHGTLCLGITGEPKEANKHGGKAQLCNLHLLVLLGQER